MDERAGQSRRAEVASAARWRSRNANIGDSSVIPVHYVSEFARCHVTVVLSETGGEEMLAGHETYRPREVAARDARLPALERRAT